MKRFYIAILTLCGLQCVASEINVNPGQLAAELNAVRNNPDPEVILTGRATTSDLKSLNLLAPGVKTLDMSRLNVIDDKEGDIGSIPEFMLLGSEVEEVVLPPVIAGIGRGAFASSRLRSIAVKTVSSIGESAFYGCGSLRDIDLSAATVSGIEPNTFSGCRSLTSVSFPESVVAIHDKAFYNSGVRKLTAPNVRNVGRYAFALCGGLEEVTIAPDCQWGEGSLFLNNALTEVPAPADVPPLYATSVAGGILNVAASEIGEGAYAGSRADEIRFIAPVSAIAPHAFRDMKDVRAIYISVNNDNVPRIDETVFAGVDQEEVALYVAQNTEDIWKGSPVWCNFDILADPSGVTSPDIAAAIRIRRSGDALIIDSDSQLRDVKVYDMGGILLYGSTPSGMTHQIDLAGKEGPVIVEARTEKETKVVKLR